MDIKSNLKKESTYIHIKDNTASVSEDMRRVLNFLMEIENEIKTIFDFKKKLKELYDHYRDLLGCCSEMAKIMKEKNLNFNYRFKDEPVSILEKVKIDIPIRSQMIILFANIEVLYFIYLAYENETIDDKELRLLSGDNKNLRKFINYYFLSKNNNFYLKNKRLLKINFKNFRELRNSLTHFFSIFPKIIIVQDYNEKVAKTEKILFRDGLENIAVISPNDLLDLIKSAHYLLFKKWSDDCDDNFEEFNRKMQFVIKLVNTKGAYVVNENDLNL